MSEPKSNPSGAPSPSRFAGELEWLDPARLAFRWIGGVLRLTVGAERSVLRVAVRRVLPVSQPEGILSIRDGKDEEVGLLRGVDGLDDESRRAVAADLARRYLVPVIRRITRARERFGVVEWEVETDRGPHSFSTRNVRDNVVNPRAGRYLLTDVDGNRYEVEDLAALDTASRTNLMQHI